MLKTIYQKFINLKVVAFIIFLSKKITLPGFEGLPFYDVFVFFIKGIQKGYLTQRAAALSFNFFLALFPAVIFFFTLIPYLPIHNFQQTLYDIIQTLLPENAFESIKTTITDILVHKRNGLLSLGFILALYFATNGISAIIDAFNQTSHEIDSRKWFKKKTISIFLVIILAVLLLIAMLLITIGSLLLHFLASEGILKTHFIYLLLETGRWIVLSFMVFVGISFLYYLGPAKKSHFRFISAGSSLATLLTLITSFGFNIYVTNFSKYNTLYGSIGTLIIVLLWIYFNSIILLIGFELNASIHNVKKNKKK